MLRHQDSLRVATGLQSELGAPVIEQIELDVTSAPAQLVGALFLGPDLVHVATHDRWICLQEGRPDVASKSEIGGPVPGGEMVIEDAADPARFVTVGQKEIFIAPLLEAWVVVGVVTIAGRTKGAVKCGRVCIVRIATRSMIRI